MTTTWLQVCSISAEQVAGDDHRAAGRGVGAQHLAHRVDLRRVQPVGRLVEHQQVGQAEHRLRDRHPLAHALAVAAHRPVDGACRGRRPRSPPSMCASSAGRPVAAQYRRQVVAAGQVRLQPGALDERAQPGQHRGARDRAACPKTLIRPSVGRIRPMSMRSDVVLPAPFGPEQAEHLAAADLEGQVADGDEAVLVGLGHALEAQRHVLAVGLDAPRPAGAGAGPSSSAAPQPSRREAGEHAEEHPPAGGAGRRPASGPSTCGTARSAGARQAGASADGVDGRLGRAGRRPGRWRRRPAASCGRPRSGARSRAA